MTIEGSVETEGREGREKLKKNLLLDFATTITEVTRKRELFMPTAASLISQTLLLL